ncbi:TPA: HD domain-containing protein [Streptococcus pneumoniae]|nr:HD domain-containing protein [Streptococcus pneumoniae]HEW8283584.1 HD domain-containing protein [Streptococcus pneumoniae]
MIDIALAIAKKAHAGQVDKAGVDYIQHPLYVASQVNTEQEKAVALLHDVIEDSDITAADLFASGLSNEVVTAVQILTNTDYERVKKYKNAIYYLST